MKKIRTILIIIGTILLVYLIVPNNNKTTINKNKQVKVRKSIIIDQNNDTSINYEIIKE